MSAAPYDVLAFAAHPDDLEAVMGGTAAKLVRKGRSMLFVDLCDGEPARYAEHGKRAEQATKAPRFWASIDSRCHFAIASSATRRRRDWLWRA